MLQTGFYICNIVDRIELLSFKKNLHQYVRNRGRVRECKGYFVYLRWAVLVLWAFIAGMPNLSAVYIQYNFSYINRNIYIEAAAV